MAVSSVSAPPERLDEELQRFVRFSLDDARLLRELRAVAEPQFVRIAAEFHDRIREHEGAHAVFSSEQQLARATRELIVWMGDVLSAPRDERRAEQVARIGAAHVRIGLPQRFLIAAMSLMRTSLCKIASDTMGASANATCLALGKALDVELALLMESYASEGVARARQRDRAESEQANRGPCALERSAIELADAIVVGLDTGAIVRLFNPAAERLTGFASEDVVGKSFYEVLEPHDVHYGEHVALPVIADGRFRPFICDVRTKSGHIRRVEWHIAARAEDRGAPSAHDLALVLVGHDSTEREAHALHERQTEKLAAVGTLAAGLAHEIRNPLNGALLHVTFLERGLRSAGVRDPETLGALSVVGDEIKRLSRLVTEFLDFARPQPPMRRKIDVRSFCERAVEQARPEAESVSVRIALDLPEAEVEVEVDPARMEQLLLNLITNSIEAMAATGGTVTVRARKTPRRVTVEVEDDGPGIAGPNAPVFDPFFSTKVGGTGLGLAVVHRIATDHSGEMSYQSQAGKTLFRLALPSPDWGRSPKEGSD